MDGWMLVGKGAWIYLFIGIVLFVSSLPRGSGVEEKGTEGGWGGGNERKTQLYKFTSRVVCKKLIHICMCMIFCIGWYYKVR
jgi:hypothetical protein